MKKTHIVLIILIAVAVGALIGTYTSSSESVGFTEAFANPGTEYKVSGQLDRSQPVIYDPQTNVELTTFHLVDKNNTIREVKLRKAKPTGLEQSESIDLYGRVENGEFIATEMLMKCPSKYNENNHSLETAEAIDR